MGVKAAFFPRFKRIVELIDSDREGERHAAADQAFEMCQEQSLSVVEAFEGAFGGSGQLDMGQQQRIDELESDNRKLAEALNVLNAQRPSPSEDPGRQMVGKLWSYAHVRLILLLLAVDGYCWAFDGFGHWLRGWGAYLNWACVFGIFALFWKWACAEYTRSGIAVVIAKALVIVGGYGIVIGFLQGDIRSACIATIWLAGLTLTNVAKWAVNQLEHSDKEVFATLRSWFV